MSYKVIFIDWNGTLSDSRFWDRWSEVSDEFKRYERIQEVLFSSEEGRRIIRDWMRGVRSAENVLRYLHEMTGIPMVELESELRYSSEHMKIADPSVINKIQTLRAGGAKVVIATDNMDIFRLWTVPALKLDGLFDGILTSDSAGALKTELNGDGLSPFFRQYLTENSLQAGDSVIIDDSEDTRILSTLGIDFLHVNQTMSLGDHLDSLITARS